MNSSNGQSMTAMVADECDSSMGVKKTMAVSLHGEEHQHKIEYLNVNSAYLLFELSYHVRLKILLDPHLPPLEAGSWDSNSAPIPNDSQRGNYPLPNDCKLGFNFCSLTSMRKDQSGTQSLSMGCLKLVHET
ncbi:hypothetical protein RJ639_010644 [Escallonia herrerae]|uniref:Uncharacterized protein n=1 Tax=Escallonia herrerae TaxID=1293975 RepID=A0AA89APQ2_9ASTE|nr:hypothetical protein RJ639_010644 [Escallonia herrerae]